MKQARIFGTDGIRKTVGIFPLTQEHLPHLGHALAQFAQQQYNHQPRILIGHDTRISCAWVKATLKSGLLTCPVKLYDAQVLPTPGVCALVEKNQQFDLGIIISASHNPYQDNGIKIITRSGKLSAADEENITNLFYESLERSTQPNNSCTYQIFGTDELYESAQKDYSNLITSFFGQPFLSGKKIVLDLAHGATSVIAQAIFTQLGAEVITINAAPNGTNINSNCGAVHPEQLATRVLQEHAFAGCAFDGDGDRITMVNHYGEFLDGDELVALLSTHPAYEQQKIIVSTIMANHSLHAWLATHNKELIRTDVGDKHVGSALKLHGALLGGEPSGHVITHDFLSIGDGIFAALRSLQAALVTNNLRMKTFTPWPQVTINIPISHKKDLTTHPYADLLAHYKSKLPQGRLIVRYSGTENLLRVMVEDANQEHAHDVGNALAHTLQQQLQ